MFAAGRCFVMALALAAVQSCNAADVGVGNGTECDPGTLRCVGSGLQRCGDSGFYGDAQDCGATNVCDDTLGCIACRPGAQVCANNNTEVHACTSEGTVGSLITACPFGQTCSAGNCVDSCELAASEFVYVVDSSNNFLSFEPRIDTQPTALKQIGVLTCSTTAQPFSMAVDRKARAWVLYNDGNIYLVNPKDASCTPSGFAANQGGFKTFGMGFVSDYKGAKTETLYIGNNQDGTKGLARIDPTSLLLSKFADFPTGVTASPEMSGTGSAEWFGYFPSATAGQHIIVLMNKSSGQFDNTWQLPALPGNPNAWAFAHWGGRYYQFVTSGGKNQIRRYDPQTGQNTIVQDSTPYRIVGAGVSTCAPVIVG